MSPWPTPADKSGYPKLRITDATHGVKIEIDGRELKGVGDFHMHFPVDDVVHAEIDLTVNKPLEIEVPAAVTINVLCYGEFEIAETVEDGLRRFVVTRKTTDTRPPEPPVNQDVVRRK